VQVPLRCEGAALEAEKQKSSNETRRRQTKVILPAWSVSNGCERMFGMWTGRTDRLYSLRDLGFLNLAFCEEASCSAWQILSFRGSTDEQGPFWAMDRRPTTPLVDWKTDHI
jgi:hypothetical protein